MNIPNTYELLACERIDEIGATAYRLHHKKTGAKVVLMDTEDDNKVFCIAFKTTPENSEGTPHIMEHSVLCGSEHFPVKDPFIELAKGSLNTFLNAFTFPDKTGYPVASRNDADLKNLMSVYMDAVFHPNIYKTEKILKQEGWHYELEDAGSELKLNGVVYNEMRGAYSDPLSVLEEKTGELLYKGTTYAHDSGGAPKCIPDLSYEKFIAFHKRYYHPSNSYIYLYGNCDFEERLNWLDEAYLSKYDRIDPHTAVTLSETENKLIAVKDHYAVSQDDDLSKSIFSYAKIVGGLFDPVENIAYQVLSYALLNAPGAPIRKALLRAGIGSDVFGGYESGYFQPNFTITAKDCEEADFERFHAIIESVLKEQAEQGIDKKALLAGISNIEFSMREADSGSFPRGLVYWMQIAETWLHEEEKAFIHLTFNKTFEKVKALLETGYYEDLLRRAFLNDPRTVLIALSPKKGLTEEEDEALRQKLAAYKATLSVEEVERIVRETAELRAYQDAPSTQEELRTIPLLSLSEIPKEPTPYRNEEREIAGKKTVFHRYVTSGIGYLNVYFPTVNLELSEMPYTGLLKGLYTLLDTERRGYNELSNEISLHTGGIGTASEIDTTIGSEELREYFVINVRYLNAEAKNAVALLTEVFRHTRFDDEKRLKEVLSEIRTNLKDSLEKGGNKTASNRVLSYSNRVPYMNELLGGIEFYRFIEDLEKNFDQKKDELIRKLYAVQEKIFLSDGMILSFTGGDEEYACIEKEIPAFFRELPEGKREAAPRNFDFRVKNEGFKTGGLVQYNAMGGNFHKAGIREIPAGKALVFRILMSYEYLWMNIRVKGGAYGCMFNSDPDGRLSFASYRDPQLKDTFNVFSGVPGYLRTLSLDPRDLTKYIIGTIGMMDAPHLPNAAGNVSMTAWISGVTEDYRKKTREGVLNCTEEDLRNLAPVIEAVLNMDQRVTVGNEGVLKKNAEVYQTLTTFSGDENE